MMWRTDEQSSLLCSGDRAEGLGIQLKSSITDEAADQNVPAASFISAENNQLSFDHRYDASGYA